MKTELAKLIDKWEIEKGSYIPNAPIYQAFIDEAKEALERESQVNNVVLDDVSKCYTEKDMDNAYDKGFNDGNKRDLTGSLIEVL
tara:strand:+ start:206 stop:460 length:255 start_codon:yes stop_codon:yes gene_type:complete